MEKLFESFEIKGCPIRNRVCFPPMVYYGAGDDSGEVTEKHVEHYRSIAAGGTGLIIQEATCISREGRLSGDQLGIWEDGQIEGSGAEKDRGCRPRGGMPHFCADPSRGSGGL